MKKFYVYILSNTNRTVLYIGYTEDLKTRLTKHKSGYAAVFTKKYNAHDLLLFEVYSSKKQAKSRERQLKNWHKDWKWNLIKESNPGLKTLNL